MTPYPVFLLFQQNTRLGIPGIPGVTRKYHVSCAYSYIFSLTLPVQLSIHTHMYVCMHTDMHKCIYPFVQAVSGNTNIYKEIQEIYLFVNTKTENC
jgi:hypothetical protein